MVQLHLKRFDMSSINDDSVVVLVGKRRTGKSYLVKDLLSYHQEIPVGTVVSATESVNEFYSNIVPSLFVHDSVSPALLSSVVKRQRQITARMKREIRCNGASKVDPRAFLILDDCMFDSKSWANDVNMQFLFLNGRHVRIFVIITMQYPLGIPPTLRTNIDYVFILKETVMSNRKRLYEQYAGMFPTFSAFCDVMDACTNNYECLVIHNSSLSNKLEDQVFWYKAEPKEAFRLGAPEFWNWHEQNINHEMVNDDDGEEMLDASTMRNSRTGPLVNVKKCA